MMDDGNNPREACFFALLNTLSKGIKRRFTLYLSLLPSIFLFISDEKTFGAALLAYIVWLGGVGVFWRTIKGRRFLISIGRYCRT